MTIYCSSTRTNCCYSICLFCCYSIYLFYRHNIHNNYNFITLSHWSISNTFEMLTILINACARIPTIIFFALTIFFTFTLTCFIIPFLFELLVVLLNLHLQSHEICFVIALASFLFIIILNVLLCVSFATHIFGGKTSQIPVHLYN